MTYYDIRGLEPINAIDEEKVTQIANSIRENGWVGCPMLVYEGTLLTGSHRIKALEKLESEGLVDLLCEMEVAEDVTEIVNGNREKFKQENGWAPAIDLSDIGWLLSGSWVEDYKSEIVEW